MASDPLIAFLQNLRRSALRRDETGLTDGQLLDAYIRDREEAAFAALVSRHGPMVWGVCRRILGNEPDAEDAFQAAFLVLVRKAASIVPQDRIANWLYGVARQTALKARAMAVRRKAREKQVNDMPEVAGAEQGGSDDLLPLLDQELSRLPEKYRSAIIQCDLEGKSYKEAARHLGCPEGTLSARLARGRALLAKRLARHGLAVSVGTMASVGLPAAVMSTTIKAATRIAAGQAAMAGVLSAPVAALTEGVLKTMLLTKLKIVSTVVLLTAAVSGTAGLIYRTQAGEQAPKAKVAVERAKASENMLQNAGFEEGDESPAHWSQGAKVEGVQYIWDKENGQRGKASLCLHKTAQRYFPIAQWYQVVDRKSDKPALRVAAQVKANEATKAILDVIFLDEDGEWIGHEWALYIGAKKEKDPPANHDWKEYTGRVEIPRAAKKIQIGLQIYGPGKVWFDEVRAEYTDQPSEKARDGQSLEVRPRDNTKLQSLLKERIEILRKNVERMKRLHERHAATLEAVWETNLRLYKAELDLCETTKDRITVLEKIANVYKEMEDKLSQLHMRQPGTLPQEVVEDATLKRLEAEIASEREKAKLAPPSKKT